MDEAGPYAGVARELAGTAFSRIRYLAETTSTNAGAQAILGQPQAAGLTIVAEHQTQGAGRKGRRWIAEPGTSLLFTTILPQEMPAADLWSVPYWTVLAVRKALAACGIESVVVWPNDVLLGARKLAGILCASRVSNEGAWAACGVGINVRRPAAGAPAIEPEPAFCSDAAPVRRTALLREILSAFDASLYLLHDAERIARTWEKAAAVPGRRYRLSIDGERDAFEATALGLANGGGLIVQRDGRERETISLADARVIRS